MRKMSELQDDIMRDVELVLRDHVGEEEALKIASMIDKRIKAACDRVECDISTAEDRADELEDRVDEAEYECKEAREELQEELRDVEWEKMVKQYWYYAERTKVTA